MSEETQIFKSHGKFLITAEYLILKGAVGLALPLKRGQTLTIQPNDSDIITWTSSVFGKTWFECTIKINDLSVITTTDEEISNTLAKILGEVRKMNPAFITTGANANIDADFNLSWGLGSSSTLINNIAQWGNVDPYILLEKTFGGSGYDIACASAKGPITYQLTPEGRKVKEVQFNPEFTREIFFVYLGKKMNSRTGMSYFKQNAKYGRDEIDNITNVTRHLINHPFIFDFQFHIEAHEKLMSKILNMPTVKESLFPDYHKPIKSMGAWGGDFILVMSMSLEHAKRYFNPKGYDTIIPYHDIVLS